MISGSLHCCYDTETLFVINSLLIGMHNVYLLGTCCHCQLIFALGLKEKDRVILVYGW